MARETGNTVDKSLFEKQKAELDALRRQNEELRKNQKPKEIKPVKMDRFIQEFSKDQKAVFVRDLKNKLLEVFTYNTPVNSLQKRSQLESAKVLLQESAVSWLRKMSRHEWDLSSCTPVYKIDKETKTDLSYIDFDFTTLGFVSVVQTLNSNGEPVKSAEPVRLKVRVLKLEVI